MPPAFPLQRSISSAAFGALPAGFRTWLKTMLAIDAEKMRILPHSTRHKDDRFV
jgi:hypothetical protein